MITQRQAAVYGRLRSLSSWCVAGLSVISASTAANAQVAQADLDVANRLIADKQFAEAAEAFEKLIPRLAPEQLSLAARLEFDRARALVAAGQIEPAVALFLKVDEVTHDPTLRSAARSNLAHLIAQQAESLAEKETPRAIEEYQRAERLYRNALPETQPDQREALARNIEIVQRRIAKLLEKQKQEQQQQQQKQDQGQDKEKPKEQDKDKSQSEKDQDSKRGENSQENKPDQQKQDQSDQDQRGQSDQSKQPQQQPKPESGKEGEPNDQTQADEQKQKEAQAGEQKGQTSEMQQADKRDFDRAAAEILDKERKHRERIRQMLQMMRRAAPVERDW